MRLVVDERRPVTKHGGLEWRLLYRRADEHRVESGPADPAGEALRSRGLLEDAEDERTGLAGEREAARHADLVVFGAEVLDIAVLAPAPVHDGGTKLAEPVERDGEDCGRVGESGEVNGGDGVRAFEEEEAVFIKGLEIVEVVGEVELEGG